VSKVSPGYEKLNYIAVKVTSFGGQIVLFVVVRISKEGSEQKLLFCNFSIKVSNEIVPFQQIICTISTGTSLDS